ncbi:hypothetical protein TrLO_g1052 [Triparma laevis f. longispina]|uniref:(3R)-3-hydroxyacyl-CoA dehydrogenase n=1 Tax=Triparma laevis f. longispina TaxID=1714387 RepID=A0A9W7E2E2_9STRA|nr:hypothetical protein TrLO_g1052 [Triparma laevis f. longispina]
MAAVIPTNPASWLKLNGKVAVVTGAGSGIGRAICQSLAASGCAVVAADYNGDSVKETSSLIANTHSKAICFPCKTDVTDSADVEKLFKRAEEMSQDLFNAPPSILVNSAGITRDGWIGNLTPGEFDDVINVNLKGSWLTSRQFSLPDRSSYFKSTPTSGSIINISSIVAVHGNLGQSNYAASKAGVLGLTRALSKELARSNIRVNAILPGFINTPMSAAVPDKVKNSMVSRIAMGRFGETEDIANLAGFLASERSGYMTGCEIECDGNISM